MKLKIESQKIHCKKCNAEFKTYIIKERKDGELYRYNLIYYSPIIYDINCYNNKLLNDKINPEDFCTLCGDCYTDNMKKYLNYCKGRVRC